MLKGLVGLRGELRPMLNLAVPVVLAELGWVAMGVVDTMMVGRIGAEALGAVGIGRALFFSVTVFGMGLLLGLDTLVSRSWGAGDADECRRWLVHGCYLALALGLPMTLLLRASVPLLRLAGIDEAVVAATGPYVRALSWGVLSLLLYTTFRRYLQSCNQVRPVVLALVTANVVNVIGNWILIFGNLGAPALGAAGAGWASTLSASAMALVLLLAVVLHDRGEGGGLARVSKAIDGARLRRLLRLGLPAASQLIVEVSAFAGGTALAALLAPVWLAAHQVALTAASVTFMVPLGISSAGAVRVGQALGRGDPDGATRAGWTAILYGVAVMLVAALLFLLLPAPIVGLFTDEAAVIAAGVTLLAVAALFQVSDGLQVVATGVLRGAGDTRRPFLWNLVGHWMLGLPLGAYLCFGANRGAVGLWIGWLLGLSVVGGILVWVWSRTTRRFV